MVGLSWFTGSGATASGVTVGSAGPGSVGAWLTSGAGVSVAGVLTGLRLTGLAVSGGASGTETVELTGVTTGSSWIAVERGFSAQAMTAGEPVESAKANNPAVKAAPWLPTSSSRACVARASW